MLAGSLPPFYIVVGSREDVVERLSQHTACKYSVSGGIMAAHCTSSEDIVKLTLSLIELGVSPLSPAAWLCGPAGELAVICSASPSPCPSMQANNVAILCRDYNTCIQVYDELRHKGCEVVEVRVRRQAKCYTLKLKTRQQLPLPNFLEIILNPKIASRLMVLSPKILPPLKFELVAETWIHGCLASKTRGSYRTRRSR
jgi:hypothetical protein